MVNEMINFRELVIGQFKYRGTTIMFYCNQLIPYSTNMTTVTPNANIQVPTQEPVEAFMSTTHEAFHEFLRTQPNRYRFTDEKYDLYKRILLEYQGRDASFLIPVHQTSPTRAEKDRQHRAHIVAIQDFCLNDDDQLCRKGNPDTGTPQLIVHRDWQVYSIIVNTHCSIPHGGQEKTFSRLSAEYYAIIRPEVHWLLKHCKVCGLNRPNRTRPPLEPIVVSHLFERVQIDLIDMRHEPDDQFKWICHMKDHWSKLSFLRAATSKTADEIVEYVAE